MNGERLTEAGLIDEQLTVELERLLVASGHDPVSVTVDRELTAGANRRTLRLIVSPVADGPDASFAAIAQLVQHDADRTATTRSVLDEGAVVAQAGANGVPVADVLLASRLSAIEGEPIEVLVTSEVEGETIPRRVLRSVGELEGGGEKLTRSCGRALARLHAIDPATVPTPDHPLPAFSPGSYLDHLTDRLDDLPDRHPTFRFAIDRLGDSLPSNAPPATVVHGDFRNGNLIVQNGELAAALDWELAHIGDPMEDLAWLCLRTWRFGVDDLEVGGFGTMADLRVAYVDAGGRWRQDAFDWWTTARTAWWGIGLAAQAAAFCEGRSVSLVHAASGRRVVELEYDLLGLLATRLS